ncbi:MAG: Calx-beta domain-containing protein, partial [Leptolyngbyaceae bacterium]|nr:Calx-beta domain-containing protein [Leptolyngbyaceae bacterium]
TNGGDRSFDDLVFKVDFSFVRPELLPTISVTDITVNEGDGATTTATVSVNLSAAKDQTVTVDYVTQNGTALAGEDYQAISGTVTFAPGEVSQVIEIPINGDTIVEADEQFQVILSNSVGAVLADHTGFITITNDDTPSPVVPTLSVQGTTVTEGQAQVVVFEVAISAATDQAVTVDYATVNQSATAGQDYEAVQGTLTFGAGRTAPQIIRVPLLDDNLDEGSEQFRLVLSNPQNADIAEAEAIATIQDNDKPPPPQNRFPIALPESYSLDEDTVLQVSLRDGLLSNDRDEDGDPLTVVLADNPANGQLSLNKNGSFRYTPNPNFNGSDRFTYVVNDGKNSSQPVTTFITVNSINDAPQWQVPSAQTIATDTLLNIPGLGVTDIDAVDGDLEISLTIANGVLNIGNPTGLTFRNGDGIEDTAFTFTGSLTTINTALASLTDRSLPGFNGPETLDLTSSAEKPGQFRVEINDLSVPLAGIPIAFDGETVWAELNDANEVIARYLPSAEIDQLVARYRAEDGTAWYLTDRLNTVRGIVDAVGDLINQIEYDSFGRKLSETNPDGGDRFGFTGREYDENTGLYYYRARYYDPELGRFISQDPIEFSGQDPNLYGYVSNNPTNATDPSGLIAAIQYNVIVTEFVSGKTGSLLGAFIGFFQGFGAANLIFLGKVLEIANTGGNVVQEWGTAIVNTKTELEEIETTLKALSIATKSLDKEGIASGFVDGVDLKFTIKLKLPIVEDIKKTLDNIEEFSSGYNTGVNLAKQGGFSTPENLPGNLPGNLPPTSFNIIQVKGSGFIEGYKAGLDYLRKLTP